jgi:3-deoxy-D-manno-octulosonate 8-phosphate phosphatase (KDO 8-P phosphatase)
MIFDVDGVLTDGRLYFSSAGDEVKAFHVRDGLGMQRLAATGVRLALLSGRTSPIVLRRAQELKIDLVFQAVSDKLTAFGDMLDRLGLDPSQAGFMGDDLNDLAVMHACGFAVSVPDAALEVRQAAHYVTRAPGGNGAVRELCDFLVAARGSTAS